MQSEKLIHAKEKSRNTCAVCTDHATDIDSIACKTCQSRSHFKCLNITPSKCKNRPSSWFCPACKTDQGIKIIILQKDTNSDVVQTKSRHDRISSNRGISDRQDYNHYPIRDKPASSSRGHSYPSDIQLCRQETDDRSHNRSQDTTQDHLSSSSPYRQERVEKYYKVDRQHSGNFTNQIIRQDKARINYADKDRENRITQEKDRANWMMIRDRERTDSQDVRLRKGMSPVTQEERAVRPTSPRKPDSIPYRPSSPPHQNTSRLFRTSNTVSQRAPVYASNPALANTNRSAANIDIEQLRHEIKSIRDKIAEFKGGGSEIIKISAEVENVRTSFEDFFNFLNEFITKIPTLQKIVNCIDQVEIDVD